MAIGKRFFYGYVIVFAVWLVMFVCTAGVDTFSVFMPVLMEELGWTSGTLSLGYTIGLVIAAVMSPVAGMLTDKIGPRQTVIIGAIIGGAGLCLISQISQPWHFYLTCGFIAPVGISLAYIVATVTTVRRWFARKAALMVSLAMTGSGLGIVVFAPLVYSLITDYGWRATYLVLGITMAVGAAIGGTLLIKSPELKGTYPDGIKPAQAMPGSGVEYADRTEQWPVSKAMKTSTFWFLILAQIGYFIAMVGLLTQFVTWGQVDVGMPPATAVSMLSVFVFSSVVGRFIVASISDALMPRFGRKPMLFLCTIGITLAMFCAPMVSSVVSATIFVIWVGFCYGSCFGLFPTYLGDLFGTANLPTLFGVVFMVISLVGAVGPWGFGMMLDWRGNYDLAFLATGVICLLSVIFLGLIKMPTER